ncbi:hypothetical protein AVEN_236933-1 [Araneus ventricosus]|uniref:Uncharacterized protein n=1 Tax=Araneus ventricosus TaxID=182803 RepID=A0A4Y2NSU4_ARAVE|nr:hypothetical protein AVEN_236933-1 [Araneus ventricosus]
MPFFSDLLQARMKFQAKMVIGQSYSGNDSSVITDKSEIDTETEEDADDIDQSHQSIVIEEGKAADKDRKISWTTAIDNSRIEVNSEFL